MKIAVEDGVLKVTLESVHWIPVGQKMPDDERTVLIFVPKDSDRVWLGYHEGDFGWLYADGSSVENPVEAWADLPEGPK